MSDFNELTAKLKACLTRNSHNWSDSVMRTCEHCGQWEMTIIGDGEMTTCASCCDAEYASNLVNNLELAIDALEAAQKRLAELGARTVRLPAAYIGTAKEFYEDLPVVPLMVVKEACAASGINLETGGEA
ncbi:hypothetical protein ACM92J_002604 [Cronobacter dublinensis]